MSRNVAKAADFGASSAIHLTTKQSQFKACCCETSDYQCLTDIRGSPMLTSDTVTTDDDLARSIEMPLIIESHDSLPYIDRPPTPTSTARAHALIASSLAPDASTTPHPLLPDLAETKFSPLIESELERIASKVPLKAIDLSRYEASSTIDVTTDQKQARQALEAAYTNSSYLGLRLQALELLEQFGKNAWLVGNSQLEDVLRSLEKELVETRQRTEDVNRERKAAQEGGRAAMEGSERAWREGVGRVVEVQLGISEAEQRWREGLRRQGT